MGVCMDPDVGGVSLIQSNALLLCAAAYPRTILLFGSVRESILFILQRSDNVLAGG